MAKVPYCKPVLSVADQIALMKKRGMTFVDEHLASTFLTFHNYYYVSGYIYYFEKKADCRTHEFNNSLDFSDIIKLIRFDAELREYFWIALQSIEFALRSSIARNLAFEKGPFCLENASLFVSEMQQSRMLEILKKSLYERRNESFISHYNNHYLELMPPIWVCIDILSLGTVSRLYDNLQTPYQKIIAGDFGIDHRILISWLKSLTELRNVCAHHSRLWNKVFVNAPKIQKKDQDFPVSREGYNRLGA